jgi:hypothetical protein
MPPEAIPELVRKYKWIFLHISPINVKIYCTNAIEIPAL